MVETSVPLSATHQGEVGSDVSPQALTRSGSPIAATPETSDTRFVTAYTFRAADAETPEPAAISTAVVSASTPRNQDRRICFSIFLPLQPHGGRLPQKSTKAPCALSNCVRGDPVQWGPGGRVELATTRLHRALLETPAAWRAP